MAWGFNSDVSGIVFEGALWSIGCISGEITVFALSIMVDSLEIVSIPVSF